MKRIFEIELRENVQEVGQGIKSAMAGVGVSVKAVGEQMKVLSSGVVADAAKVAGAVKAQGEAVAGAGRQAEVSAGGHKRLSMQLREMQNELAKMRLAGQDSTPVYRELSDRAAVLSDTIGDLRAQTNVLAHDNAKLQGVISGASGLVGGFTALTGAMSLVAGENEDLAKLQTKLQGVMAVTMGVQQLANTLNRDSAFRLVTLAKAKEVVTGANARLGASFGAMGLSATASKVAVAGLYGTLTLGASVLIGAGIAAWSKYSERQEEVKKRQEELAEGTRELHKGVGDGAVQSVAKLRSLSEGYRALGDNLKAKQLYVSANAKEFKGLGLSIKGVNDAEGVLVRNTKVFEGAMVDRARAAAYMKKVEESVGKEIELGEKSRSLGVGNPILAENVIHTYKDVMTTSVTGGVGYERRIDGVDVAASSRKQLEQKRQVDGEIRQLQQEQLAYQREWSKNMASATGVLGDGWGTVSTVVRVVPEVDLVEITDQMRELGAKVVPKDWGTVDLGQPFRDAEPIIRRYAEEMKAATQINGLFGDGQAVVKGQLDVTRGAIEDLIREGFSPMGAEVRGLMEEWRRLNEVMTGYDRTAELVKSTCESIKESMKQLTVDGLVGLSEGIAGLISGDMGFGDLLKSMGVLFANFLKTVGTQLIEIGVTMLLAKKSIALLLANPVTAIAAGAALVLTAGLLTAAFNKGAGAAVPKFANGGIVSGPTFALVGEYAGAANNPEVIAPLSRLRDMISPAGGDGGEVRFEIDGDRLVGILRREGRRSRSY